MIQNCEKVTDKVWFRIITKDYERVIDLNKVWTFKKYIQDGKWRLILRFGIKENEYFWVDDDEKAVVKIYDELLKNLYEKGDWFRIISKKEDRIIDLNKIWTFKKTKIDGKWVLTLRFGVKNDEYLEINDQNTVLKVYNELIKRFELEK